MLLLVVFLEVCLNAAEDAVKSVAIQAEQLDAVAGDSDRERSSDSIDERDLAEVGSTAKHSYRIDVAIVVFVTELNLTFLHDVEMVSAVTLMEYKFASKLGLGRQTVNQLDLLVLLEFVEELDLVEEVERDVASADAVLSDRELEALAGQHPSLAVRQGSY